MFWQVISTCEGRLQNNYKYKDASTAKLKFAAKIFHVHSFVVILFS